MRTAILYNFLIETNIMASMAIILMAVLRRWLRKPLGNQALMFGWLLVTLRLLLPLSIGNPIIHTIRSPFAEDPAIRPIAGQVKVRFADMVNSLSWQAQGDVQTALQGVRNDMDSGMLSINLFKFYLLGAAIVLSIMVYRNIRFLQGLKKAKVSSLSGESLKSFHALCQKMKLKPVPVYLMDPLPAASLVGIFKPYIALPLSLGKEDIPLVLSHELCHLKHRDNLFGLLRLIACVVHWFNPLVWLYAAMSRTDMEQRCDDSVTQDMNEEQRQQYAGILVKIAAKKQTPNLTVVATGMTMTGKRLKNRVQDILLGKKNIGILKISFMVLASMMLIAAFSTSELKGSFYQNKIMYNETYSLANLKGTQKLKSTEQLAQYAEKIAAIIGAKGEVTDYEVANPKDFWRFVTLSFDSGDVVECEIGRTGVVRYTSIVTAGPRWNSGGELSKVNYEKDLEAQEAARQTLKALLEQINPGQTKLYNDLVYQNSWGYEGKDFVHFWAQAKDGTMDDYFTLELNKDGTARVIYFTLGGNG
jgi:beta-lactamase regulating signal transducer with metallopeptidase domain